MKQKDRWNRNTDETERQMKQKHRWNRKTDETEIQMKQKDRWNKKTDETETQMKVNIKRKHLRLKSEWMKPVQTAQPVMQMISLASIRE